jgi:hypothetical protein
MVTFGTRAAGSSPFVSTMTTGPSAHARATACAKTDFPEPFIPRMSIF